MIPSELKEDNYNITGNRFQFYVVGVTEKPDHSIIVAVCDKDEGLQGAESRLEILANRCNEELFPEGKVIELPCHRFTSENGENGVPRIRLHYREEGLRIPSVY